MNKKKMIRVLSIGTILGGIVSAGIPITAEAVINAYTVKVNDEFYKYDKQELIDDFLNFKCGDKSTLYDDFARKLKEGNGFYAFQDTEKGFIDYGDIRDAFLKTKEENKSFDVEEFVKTKEAKVIEVSWVKKAIVTKDGEVKYETPLNKDDKEKQDSKENEEKEKQDDDKSKDVVNDESKTSEHKSSSHHKKKHSHKSSSDGVVKEKDQGKQEEGKQEKEVKEKEKQEQGKQDKELKEKQEKEQAQKDKELKEKQEKEQAQKDKELKEKQEKEQAQKDKELKEKQEKEQAQKDKELKEKQEQEQAQKDKELKEKQEQEQAQKDKELKEKQEQEKEIKEIAELLRNDKKIEVDNTEKVDKIIEEAIKQLKPSFTLMIPYKERNKYNLDKFNDIMVELGGHDYGKPRISAQIGGGSLVQGKMPMTVELNYMRNIAEVKKQKKDTEAAVKKIIKEVIKGNMTPVEKELALHDYVVKHADYNMQGLNKNPIDLEDHSAYGVLVLGKGVCESYAKAMHLLLNEAGIECKYATGHKKNTDGSQGSGHAWNMIKLDNDWYNLDATWDDPVSDRVGGSDKAEAVAPVLHTYFNVADDVFNKDHIRGEYEEKNYPKANGTKYCYDNLNIPEYTSDGLLIEKVTGKKELDKKILNIFKSKKSKSVLRLKDVNMDMNQLQAEVNKVINDNKINIGFKASYGLQGNYFSCEFKFN